MNEFAEIWKLSSEKLYFKEYDANARLTAISDLAYTGKRNAIKVNDAIEKIKRLCQGDSLVEQRVLEILNEIS